MRGLHLDAGRLTYRTDLPEPVVGADETLVQVLRAGVCATDLALARGYMGFAGVPGHEFVGVAVSGPLAGQRVVGEINAACGTCADCLAGNDRHCPYRSVLGILGRPGAFAERLALPTRNLLAVPDDVSTDAATFTEPLAAACQIPAQIEVGRGMRALVAGDGKLGLLCAAVLAARGCDVKLIGRHPERATRLGLDVATASGWFEPDAPPITLPAAERFDVAVEATGNPNVLPRLLGLVRPRGTIVLKTTTEQPIDGLDLAPLVVDEITLLGSRCGRFGPALELLAAHEIAVESLVDGRYALTDGVEAFGHAGRGGVLKVLVDVDAEAER